MQRPFVSRFESLAMKHIRVSCAIIERDGLVLAVQRNSHMSMPLKWEFPGGKIDRGESAEECLRRELAEELSIEIGIEKRLASHTHHYSAFTVTLHPFVCTLKAERIVLHEHKALSWLPPESLETLDWAEADRPVIADYLEYAGCESRETGLGDRKRSNGQSE